MSNGIIGRDQVSHTVDSNHHAESLPDEGVCRAVLPSGDPEEQVWEYHDQPAPQEVVPACKFQTGSDPCRDAGVCFHVIDSKTTGRSTGVGRGQAMKRRQVEL